MELALRDRGEIGQIPAPLRDDTGPSMTLTATQSPGKRAINPDLRPPGAFGLRHKDWVVRDAVTSEPVSALFSLLTGNLQGNSFILRRFRL